ncbi:3-hydroxyacyl-CoA dehydrogenase NAD-binding domain-containing protein [Kordiimonas laminariae]|uniref:3-hydroxyacyl-CoA dehydrogenase NAD-binding domain-containing protein n=1 Tax=Kordiimonas laminariae TaxID=2917717 RepID=UPI001FF1D592|nr:3-hydroxyacyl-CoA dehydrogenase NAD-binding domain-containing protein [Kordiimonas laminariae]MCK0070913.1 3-hydroxyacyl-CoA dehydrogenase NAD-binding domain-containing protein [Kordiimonas laminariae]
MSVVSRSDNGNIAVLSINNPPVNALSHAVREGLQNHMRDLAADDTIEAIVVACEGSTFIAGADIREFGSPPKAPHLGEVVDQIEAMEKPVVAAIHGTALGGGLEVALSCHYRVALSSAKIGLPEVKLGILPGAGGTQRLPRIAGVDNALNAIVSGQHFPAKVAAKWGAIDDVVEDGLVEAAISYAESKIADGPRRTGDIEIDDSKYDADYFVGFRKSIARQTRGYFAPERCIQCVEAAVSMPLAEGLKRERELFMECMSNPQARALQHMFFAERQVSRIPDIDKSTPRREIKKVGIIGAGTMGGGIAMNFVNVGIPVTILEVQQDALDRGLGVVRGNYERSAKKGKLTPEQVEDRMGLFSGTLSYDDLSDCDLIIEAVFEKMEIKKEVFAKLDAVAKDGAILASNTSYLNIDEMADSISRPGDVIGLHFFSPANVMRLLEIVRGAKTAPDVLATCVDLAKAIRKVGVVAGVCPGFIGNRMLAPYGREASLNVIEGCAPEEVDTAIFNFGMPMGPMTMSDMAGLDIGYMNRQSMGRENYETKAYDWTDRVVESGRKGLKVGAGVYDYDEGSRTPKPSADVMAIIEEESAKLGIERSSKSAEEIVERSFFAMINEGAKILGEGMAYRASDIDVVYANGYGFPPYRGGPMHYADSLGLDYVYKRICEFREESPRWWEPAPLLEKLAGEGKSFADFDKENAA